MDIRALEKAFFPPNPHQPKTTTVLNNKLHAKCMTTLETHHHTTTVLCPFLQDHRGEPVLESVSWSLTSLFSTNMAISEMKPVPEENF